MGDFLFKRLVVGVAIVFTAHAAQAKEVVRCGWYANPTPANHWLTDAHSTWYLSTQGAQAAKGWLDLPEGSFKFDGPKYWHKVNGDYGYGCACITGIFGSAEEGKVVRVSKLETLPLSRCEADRKLLAP
jgi:hypothetical protein